MSSIWSFLLQTLTVAAAAGLLLCVKQLLADKLSPRWQYGVWAILAVRLLVPAGTARGVLLPLPLWVETWKSIAERGLGSAYADAFTPVRLTTPFPTIVGAPQSVTDWLFVIYVAGVAAVLLWYLASYARLRLLLRRGGALPAERLAQVAAVAERYGLRGCRAVVVPGLPSAFVCGVIRPVLALPEEDVDDKVLLHELLHLHYRDALQSIGWCVLRALHWCDPFLQYVFDRIGNDMESLCDQRVLERLEGEERRAYGVILLSMANDRYPRAPGTTSLSNGGRNIARRIAAIVRFRKYPRGMALVSVCVAVALAAPLLVGTVALAGRDAYTVRPGELDQAMALTRLRRCTTLAGALDTYAKGLRYGYGLYLATASPLSEQARLCDAMQDGISDTQIQTLPAGVTLAPDPGPLFLDLAPREDGSFGARIAFCAWWWADADGAPLGTDREGSRAVAGFLVRTVRLWQEDGAWVVAPEGDWTWTVYRDDYDPGDSTYLSLRYAEWLDPETLRTYTAQGVAGTLRIDVRTQYLIDDTARTETDFFGFATYREDSSLRPDAAFSEVRYTADICYTLTDEGRRAGARLYGMRDTALWTPDQVPTVDPYQGLSPGSTVGSSEGVNACRYYVTDEWDGTCRDLSGGTVEQGPVTGLAVPPCGYQVEFLLDDRVVDRFRVGEVE